MNTDLARKIILSALRHPERHSQSYWYDINTRQGPVVLSVEDVNGDAPAMCGTTCCIAGWSLLHDGWEIVSTPDHGTYMANETYATMRAPHRNLISVEGAAANVLGIDYDTANDIFYEMDERAALAKLWLLTHGQPIERSALRISNLGPDDWENHPHRASVRLKFDSLAPKYQLAWKELTAWAATENEATYA